MREKVFKVLCRVVVWWLARNPARLKVVVGELIKSQKTNTLQVGRDLVKRMDIADAVAVAMTVRDRVRGK